MALLNKCVLSNVQNNSRVYNHTVDKYYIWTVKKGYIMGPGAGHPGPVVGRQKKSLQMLESGILNITLEVMFGLKKGSDPRRHLFLYSRGAAWSAGLLQHFVPIFCINQDLQFLHTHNHTHPLWSFFELQLASKYNKRKLLAEQCKGF